jgi:hypothetical protein
MWKNPRTACLRRDAVFGRRLLVTFAHPERPKGGRTAVKVIDRLGDVMKVFAAQ